MSNWHLHAACRDKDPELFFPIGTSGPALEQAELAKAVCRHCPVTEQCLAFALTHRIEYGVWGGVAEGERAPMLRSLPPPPPPPPARQPRPHEYRQCRQCGHPFGGSHRRAYCEDCRRRSAVAECGTLSGYRRHKATGTPTCQPCRDAAAAYNRARRARKRAAV